MEWSIFAVVQTLVVAFGVTIALWFRMRAVNKQNEALRTYCESLRTAPATPAGDATSTETTPADWANDLIDALDPEDPLTPLQRLVLEHATETKEDFADELKASIAAAGLSTVAAPQDESEPQAPAGEQSVVVEPAAPNEDQQEELRALLRQFTQDSREMMLCIQTLEKENAALIQQLTELGVTPVEMPGESKDADERVDEVPEDPPEKVVSESAPDSEADAGAEADSDAGAEIETKASVESAA